MTKMLTASTLLGPSFVPAMKDTAEMGSLAQVSTSQILKTYRVTSVVIPKLLLEFCSSSDIDECQEQSPCDQNANCTNTPGSFTCTCNVGYQGDGLTCTGLYTCVPI